MHKIIAVFFRADSYMSESSAYIFIQTKQRITNYSMIINSDLTDDN